MASPLLKKNRQQTLLSGQNTHLGDPSLYQSDSYTGRDKLKSNKTFTEWLLSPSLYPSDERILSGKLVARRSSEFKGCFYSLETSRATYTFFCPSDAALKRSWPRLKALWGDFSRRYPGRVQGVRFLRTVAELPIWLDDDPIELRVNTPVRHRGEIACLVERRIINRLGIEQLAERGFYADEVIALSELVDLQQPTGLNYRHSSMLRPMVCDVPSELLPYELLIKEVSRGIEFELGNLTCGDIELLTYEGGTLAWGLKSESTREGLLSTLRQSFGPGLIESLSQSTKKSISQLAFSLISSKLTDSADADNATIGLKLRQAVKDLIIGPRLTNAAIVVIDPDSSLSNELAKIFETQVVSDYKDVKINNFVATYGSVSVVHLEQTNVAPKVVQALKSQGIRVLTVQKCSDSKAGIIEVSPRQSLADQAIDVLRGISNSLGND